MKTNDFAKRNSVTEKELLEVCRKLYIHKINFQQAKFQLSKLGLTESESDLLIEDYFNNFTIEYNIHGVKAFITLIVLVIILAFFFTFSFFCLAACFQG
jgi:hypothetical protein